MGAPRSVTLSHFLPSPGALRSELPPHPRACDCIGWAHVWHVQGSRADYRLTIMEMTRLPLAGCALAVLLLKTAGHPAELGLLEPWW